MIYAWGPSGSHAPQSIYPIHVMTMNNERTGFFRTDLREAVYMLGFASLGILVVSIYSTQTSMLIGSFVIGMTLGKVLARWLRRRFKT